MNMTRMNFSSQPPRRRQLHTRRENPSSGRLCGNIRSFLHFIVESLRQDWNELMRLQGYVACLLFLHDCLCFSLDNVWSQLVVISNIVLMIRSLDVSRNMQRIAGCLTSRDVLSRTWPACSNAACLWASLRGSCAVRRLVEISNHSKT